MRERLEGVVQRVRDVAWAKALREMAGLGGLVAMAVGLWMAWPPLSPIVIGSILFYGAVRK